MARLTSKDRAAVPTKQFGLPDKAPGRGSYPMPDKSHARAALAMDHNASPADRKKIEAKAHRMYPSMGGRPKNAGSMRSLSCCK